VARKLRGSDFLMRWSQGYWSEERLFNAINQSGKYYAIAYGPTGVAPKDPEEYEKYFARLEAADLGKIKRPDLLIFEVTKKEEVSKLIESLGGVEELPFISEKEPVLQQLIQASVIGVECENSLWRASKMPAYGKPLKPMARLGGRPGLPKTSVLPTIIIKEEDRLPLLEWQNTNNKEIHVWHSFFDRAYGLSLNEAQRLVDEGLIEPTAQTFSNPGGGGAVKVIYKFYYHYAYELGEMTEAPTLEATYIEDNNGHILPYVTFSGGVIRLNEEVIQVLDASKKS
jgi:hypothetical protein